MLETLQKQKQKEETDISPIPLYQLALGFAATKVLLVAQRLGFFAALAKGSRTAGEIAKAKKMPSHTTEMLLNACVSLKLCEKSDGAYRNTPLTQRFLVPGQRGYLGDFMGHFNDHMYPAWIHLEEAIKTGHAQIQQVIGQTDDHFFQAIDRQTKDLENFMQTMEEHSQLEGDALAHVYDFSPHKELLDVAGGTGAMSVAILERHPHLRVTVFDRPPVCEIAARNLQKIGLQNCVRLVAGDFFTDPLPKTADVLLLSGILHNWAPENARRILTQCAEACKPGGTLLISEQVLNDAKTEPLPATLCSLNMLVMLEGAQEYSRAEFEAMLTDTGFCLEEIRPTGAGRQLLIARRK
ncbi:MAG: methyltransferase [Elusimicrobiota bacterium]|jgi:ubiquinone/menaquinone biosynthesis C-methylase UbiE